MEVIHEQRPTSEPAGYRYSTFIRYHILLVLGTIGYRVHSIGRRQEGHLKGIVVLCTSDFNPPDGNALKKNKDRGMKRNIDR